MLCKFLDGPMLRSLLTCRFLAYKLCLFTYKYLDPYTFVYVLLLDYVQSAQNPVLPIAMIQKLNDSEAELDHIFHLTGGF